MLFFLFNGNRVPRVTSVCNRESPVFLCNILLLGMYSLPLGLQKYEILLHNTSPLPYLFLYGRFGRIPCMLDVVRGVFPFSLMFCGLQA